MESLGSFDKSLTQRSLFKSDAKVSKIPGKDMVKPRNLWKFFEKLIEIIADM